MSITNLPLFTMLRARMQWSQERQRLLAENVAQADSPNYRPRDLAPLRFDQPRTAVASLGLDRTQANHIVGITGAPGRFQDTAARSYDVRPSGNAVNVEDEMIKVAANQMDYQAAATLYTRSLGLIKTAIGKR